MDGLVYCWALTESWHAAVNHECFPHQVRWHLLWYTLFLDVGDLCLALNLHAVALSVSLKVALLCGHKTRTSVPFFLWLGKTDVVSPGPTFPVSLFHVGNFPFRCQHGERILKLPQLDYSLVNRLYLFQFSLHIVFPCPTVKQNVQGSSEWCVLGFFTVSTTVLSFILQKHQITIM